MDGHQNDESPTSDEISILWERTKDFIDELMIEKYGNHFQSSEISNIIKELYQVQPIHQFEISFTLEIILDASTYVRGSAAGGLLTNKNHLKQYVENFVRYYYLDDGLERKKNGLFYYTQEALAKIEVKGMINQRARLRRHIL